MAEIFSFQLLHGENALAVWRLAVSDMADDARVAQLRQDLRLAPESLGFVRTAPASMQQLEGY